MYIITHYELESNTQNDEEILRVKNLEEARCPCCGEKLIFNSSRLRTYIRDDEKKKLRIRRMKCHQCHKIHTELPDFIMPFKRYAVDNIERIVEEPEQACTWGMDSSTIRRFKALFLPLPLENIIGSLEYLQRNNGEEIASVEDDGNGWCDSPFARLKRMLGLEQNWLSKLVRLLVNGGCWQHTRSA